MSWPKKKRTADEGSQEAVEGNGNRLVGTFEHMGGWYQFWKPGREVRKDQADRTFLTQDLTQPPTTPLTVRCINEYKAAREKLDALNKSSGQCVEREAWKELRDKCKMLEKQLEGLHRDVSFEEEVRFIEEILDNQDQLKEFLDP